MSRDECDHPDHNHPDGYAAVTCKANQLDGYHLDTLCPCCGEPLPCPDRCLTADGVLEPEDEEC